MSRGHIVVLGAVLTVTLWPACEGESTKQEDTILDAAGDADSDTDTDADTDADSDADTDTDTDTDSDSDSISDTDTGMGSCDFGYDSRFSYRKALSVPGDDHTGSPEGWMRIGEKLVPIRTVVRQTAPSPAPDYIVMPEYTDDMPLFERASAWQEPTRCYELPDGAFMLTEDEAYDLYKDIAEKTTGVDMDTTVNVRTVVGLRGAYPGTFEWHGNSPDRFNDTLALLWIDGGGDKHVREFPVNTDTGAYDYSVMSSLRPNRRYHHYNGWHSTYNALQMGDINYSVRDDANSNGHWDSYRNGWLPPSSPQDFDRIGGAHNIHMGSVNAPLGTAEVGLWSAGCQVIPGMANWDEFITYVWTGEGDDINYFLVDARDIEPTVWEPCDVRDGSHRCPYVIASFPFTHEDDTSLSIGSEFSIYNCSSADESGPEVVYLFTIDRSGTLTVTVDCDAPVDIDIHLLEGDEEDACRVRGHETFSTDITPGRYYIVADTYVTDTDVLEGPYTITVELD